MPEQWQRIAELFVLPPGLNLVLLIPGLLLIRRSLGRWLAWSGTLGLLLCSLPAFANLLFSWLEPYPALADADLHASQAEAIVVLTAGFHRDQKEYGGRDVLSALSMERIRYAAWLYRHTWLPVVVSGGRIDRYSHSLAELAAEALKRQFQVKPIFLEDRSQTTRENARFTAELLRRHHWRRILLVSSAWHLPRAVEAFRRQGIDVIPAPTAFLHRDQPMTRLADWLPNAKALLRSYYGLHELLGRVWYRVSG